MSKVVATWILLGAVHVACAPDSIVVVPTGPGTDYPCGVGWYVCANSPPAPHRLCCLVGDICGGDQGPDQPNTCGVAGMCCNDMNEQASTNHTSVRRIYSAKGETAR